MTEEYNDEYATCDRTAVHLNIYTGASDPDEVTRATGLTPTRLTRQGEIVLLSRGRHRVSPLNAWFLDTEDHVTSRDLRRHIDWVLTRIVEAHFDAAALRQRGWDIRFNCVWWSQYNTGGPILWPRQLIAIGNLGLECGFEFAFYGDDEEA